MTREDIILEDLVNLEIKVCRIWLQLVLLIQLGLHFLITDGMDPFAESIVHSNTLSDPEDFNNIIECVEYLKKVIKSFPSNFDMVNAISNIPVANCVSATCTKSWYFVRRCIAGSIADGYFKAIGLSNLREIDAFVIPKVPTSDEIIVSTYTLAEFASDILIDEYISVENYTNKYIRTEKVKKCQKKDTKNGKYKGGIHTYLDEK